ncbi:cobalamin-binding protein [Camelliibacillus cellulosilyticus]|uniref:Cobalamin-binding protein n=1 Tax=Camelliibacillus cellulosilyticus TaxID=2174486 RepID=A0ABV9GMF0_9BACL
MRIVSLCPSNTELVAYLGANSQLVGIDNYSDWPAEVRELPRLGPDLDIDMTKVEALKPDLVLASLSVPGMEKNVDDLKQSGLPYVVLNPQSLADIADDLLTLGDLMNKKEQASQVVDRYHRIIDDYRERSLAIEEKPKLYWEWWPKPVFTPGRKNWLTEISAYAGAENIFRDRDCESVKTDWSDVVRRDPDHICLVWVGVDPHKVKREFVLNRTGADRLAAVQSKKIHLLEESLFCRPSPRLLTGLRKIAALLHPEIFPAFQDEDPLLIEHDH